MERKLYSGPYCNTIILPDSNLPQKESYPEDELPARTTSKLGKYRALCFVSLLAISCAVNAQLVEHALS